MAKKKQLRKFMDVASDIFSPFFLFYSMPIE